MSLKAMYDSLNRMRELTNSGIPFSFSFISCSVGHSTTSNLKVVNKALLRTGYSRDKGIKSQSLIAYHDIEKDREGFFYLPLLMTFKGINVCQ